jgi:superfamily II DNA or RNA helicase
MENKGTNMIRFHEIDNKVGAIHKDSGFGVLKKRLYAWQKECLALWWGNKGRGIVNVVTGAGKTVLALGAISKVENNLCNKTRSNLKIKIIVPKIFLANQWVKVLKSDFGISEEDIGIFTGIRKDPTNRKYMIYVINSARFNLSNHILEDFKKDMSVFLIADECHHYGSRENSRVFDFITKIPDINSKFNYFSLGLSATPEGKYYEEIIIPALGEEIYKYSFAEALNANIINHFSIFNVQVNFTKIEKNEYNALSEQISMLLSRLRSSCSNIFKIRSSKFFAALENLTKSSENENIRMLSRSFLILSIKRKEIIYRAVNRINCVIDILNCIPNTSKIIIFNERIDVTNLITDLLHKEFPGQVGCYHSGLDNNSKRKVLRKYENDELRILVTCKALDEGLNVSQTDVGIIVSSTSSNRQRIQRLGRILRRSDKKNIARLFYLHINSSNEEQQVLSDITREMKGRIPIVDLVYNEDDRTFYHAMYDDLVGQVLEFASDSKWPDPIISEIKRNLEIGKLRCDWWMSEESCTKRIHLTINKEERNYLKSILLLIRARTNCLD